MEGRSIGLAVGEGTISFPSDTHNHIVECKRFFLGGVGSDKHPAIKDCMRKEKASVVILQESMLEDITYR